MRLLDLASCGEDQGERQTLLGVRMMTTDATENSNLADRRGVEREASAQLTTLTSLLAGFGFAWFTTLAGNETSTLFSLAVLVVTALAIFVLVLASIVGALLTIASGLAIVRRQIIWDWLGVLRREG